MTTKEYLDLLKGAPITATHKFGVVRSKMLGDGEISCAYYHDGERRIYVMQRDPVELVERIVIPKNAR